MSQEMSILVYTDESPSWSKCWYNLIFPQLSKKVGEVLWEGRSPWLSWEHAVGLLLFFRLGIRETWAIAQAWPTMWGGHGRSSLWFSFLIHKMRGLGTSLVAQW